jgi:uncharacterized protein (DUF433 family)
MLSTIEHVQEREGEYYVAQTRVPIGAVIASWKRNTLPDRIVEQFPTLTLADVYGAITYYLDHQEVLEAHFAALREEYERERLHTRADHLDFFADLRERRDAWRAVHPERASSTHDQDA